MNFLATRVFQSHPTTSTLHLPSSTHTRGEDCVWCVFYVKSMVSGQCESKSKPVVKTNFIYHRRVPCIIITPAQQLRLWIHNQTKLGRTKCSKVAIHISNRNEWNMIVQRCNSYHVYKQHVSQSQKMLGILDLLWLDFISCCGWTLTLKTYLCCCL